MIPFLLAALVQPPPAEPTQDLRRVEVRLEASGAAVVPVQEACDLRARIVVEDGTGWPLPVLVSSSEVCDTGYVFFAPIGSTLEVAAYLAPYPVAEQQIAIHAGVGVQVSTLRFEEPVELHRLRIDVVSERSVAYRDYFLEVLSPKLGIPFVFPMKDEIHSGVSLPADTYTVFAPGRYVHECGLGLPSLADHLGHRTRVDLRHGPQAIRIRPKVGGLLRFRVEDPGIPASQLPASQPQPRLAHRGQVEHAAPWARLRLVNLATGQELEPRLGWKSMAHTSAQLGFPVGHEVFATDRVPAGTYDLHLRGLSLLPLQRRIVVTSDTNEIIALRPRLR